MASSFNKSRSSKVKLDLLTDINILLVVEKGIRGGIIDMQKLITNAWKILIKLKDHHIFHRNEKKALTLMNKHFYLGLSILELSKIIWVLS